MWAWFILFNFLPSFNPVSSDFVLALPEEQHRSELLEEQLRETTEDALKQRNGKICYQRVPGSNFPYDHV